MASIIYVVRHARYAAPPGLTDTENRGSRLSRSGIVQAYLLAIALRLRGVGALFSSPLVRTLRTAEVISRLNNIPVGVDSRFSEYVPSAGMLGKAFKEAKARGRRERDWHADDGESFNDSVARFEEGLRAVAAVAHTKTYVVSHALVTQNVIMHRAGLTEPPEIHTISISAFKVDGANIQVLFFNRPAFPGARFLSKVLRRLLD